jgi:hypothetical protein
VRLSVKRAACRFIKATGLDRKSGGAQWRDLRFFSGKEAIIVLYKT